MIFQLSIFDFAGSMHPVLVHLPIGILLFVSLYYLGVSPQRRAAQHHLIRTALLWGMISAVGACISGWVLSRGGDYEAAVVGPHQWMGIATALLSLLCYGLHQKGGPYLKWLLLLLVGLITVAGHLGGSITHGEGYLTAAFRGDPAPGKTIFKPIANVQEAFVYNDLIKPILSAKCYSCHGTSKQKGKLRLDAPDFILKGGKEGAVVSWDHADESSLIERILLAETDEDHMPPKEKPQLTQAEKDLLQWWVNSGAGFDKKVGQVEQPARIQPALLALQNGQPPNESKEALLPQADIAPADPQAITAVREKGAVVIPVAANSHYLLVNFVGADTVTLQTLQLLEPLQQQLVWLKLAGAYLRDPDLAPIGKLRSLRRLHLEGNVITDKGLQHLQTLAELRYLNLSGTRVSGQGLESLKGLKKLKKLFLYQVPQTGMDLSRLKQILPQTAIDTGGYQVPTLQSDTTIFLGKTPL